LKTVVKKGGKYFAWGERERGRKRLEEMKYGTWNGKW
jgi:hypothetical protein